METPITPEALIELGFEKTKDSYILDLDVFKLRVFHWINDVWVVSNDKLNHAKNLTTIEDIKDLIRLFK